MKYIDADIMRAEIKRRIDATINIHHIPCHRREELEGLLSFIDSLQQEQPEVDLRREIEKYFDGWFDGDEYGQAVMGASRNHYCACVDDCKDIARHFYELGQKDAANKFDEIEYNRQRAQEQEGQR